MSERGVFAIDRGVFDHDCFADEAFTEREAWMWLVSQAAWKAKRVRVGIVRLDLMRGQLSHSLRFMADKWQWYEPRVRRFLNRLKTDAMIVATADAGVTLITICNYDKYQRVSLPSDAAADAPSDAAPTQHRRKEEDIKYIEEEKISSDDWPKDFREVFWQAYPRKEGKQGALRELERVRKRAVVTFAKLIAAVRAYAATADPKFTKHPQTWLTKGCWDDELPKSFSGTPGTAPAIKVDDPTWNIWKAHFRDTGQNTRAMLMDKSASDGKAFTVPSEYPPGYKKDAA